MDKIIYLSPRDLSGINLVNELGNSDTFVDHLGYVDYHFLLFSTLYQSGAKFIQLEIEELPFTIKNNPFWKEKLIDIEKKTYDKSSLKAKKIVDENLNIELDQTYRAPQYAYLHNYFTNLFYSSETGIPFINVDFVGANSFDFLESRLTKELFHSIKNFNSLIESDTVSTITPQYSILKKDVQLFEDIVTSLSYRNYSNSLGLLTEDPKIEMVKKEIHINALKVYSKYSNHLDLKAATFGFLKFNKKLADLFIGKSASIFGDFLIEMSEKLIGEKRKISYYKIEEAHTMLLWGNRITELINQGGKEKFDEFLRKYNNNKNSL